MTLKYLEINQIYSFITNADLNKVLAINFTSNKIITQVTKLSHKRVPWLICKIGADWSRFLPALWLCWLNRDALISVDPRPQDVVRRWFEARQGTSRKVFILGYSSTQRFPHRKCLLLVIYISHSTASYQRFHPRISVNPRCTKEGPKGGQCLSTDNNTIVSATFYK